MIYRSAIYVVLITSIVFGKSYTIDNIEIQSTIGKDGIVRITEKRTFTFKGSFTYVYQIIKKNNFKEIFDIQVSENGRYYICLLYTSPSPRDGLLSRMPSSA